MPNPLPLPQSLSHIHVYLFYYFANPLSLVRGVCVTEFEGVHQSLLRLVGGTQWKAMAPPLPESTDNQ